MARKQRLLAAVTDLGYVYVRRALGSDFDLVPAFSMMQARTALKAGDIDAVVCSIHFDESRMFELLEDVRHMAPGVPFVCARMLHSPLTEAGLACMEKAAVAQGAAGFIDYHSLRLQHGPARAAELFGAAFRNFVTVRTTTGVGDPRQAGVQS